LLKAAPAAAAIGLALTEGASADQPRMQAALDALKIAKRELEAATPDKGGHRRDALRLVNQAIVHVEKGIAFDRRR
jgi:hypothetical protein